MYTFKILSCFFTLLVPSEQFCFSVVKIFSHNIVNIMSLENYLQSRSFILGPAMITDPPNNITIEYDEGENIVLICTARSNPRPTITWSPGPDSSRTVATSESVDIQGFPVITSNINITNLQRNDTTYTCNASNSEGFQIRLITQIDNCKFDISDIFRSSYFIFSCSILM